MAQTRFDAQVLKIAALVGGSLSSAKFLFQDLSTEAAFTAARHRIAFCKHLMLRSTLSPSSICARQTLPRLTTPPARAWTP